MSNSVDPKELLAAGAHFGHRPSRWHPKMAPYIHGVKGDVHIIDLVKTAVNLEQALEVVTKNAASGKEILFVGTKRQAQAPIREAAESVSQPYVVERWLGGMLTNWQTMSGRIKKLKKLEEQMASGELEAKYNKLEVQRFQEEIDRLNHIFGGVKSISGTPGLVFVVDVKREQTAIQEARKLNVPVIAIADTNVDPTGIDFVIPANDDAIKTIDYVTKKIAAAVEAGKAVQKSQTKDKES